MSNEYQHYATATRNLSIKELVGVPADIKLHFSAIEVRFYRGSERYFFKAGLAIPGMEDDQGFVWEEPLQSTSKANRATFGIAYEAPLQDLDFDALSNAAVCSAENMDEKHDGRYLRLVVKVSGTPFSGQIVLDPQEGFFSITA